MKIIDMLIARADAVMLDEALPCPFCGGENLATSAWHVGQRGDEVTAIKCRDCNGGAPFDSWQRRAKK